MKKPISHSSLMLLCCALPIVIMLLFTAGIIALPANLAPFILLLCPLMMIPMMYLMHRNHKHKQD
ncbi:hypothetical protein [Spirochaeta dissipatitropha]